MTQKNLWTKAGSNTEHITSGFTTITTYYNETNKGLFIRTVTCTTLEWGSGKYAEDRRGTLREVVQKNSSSSTDITFIPDMTWDDFYMENEQ